MLYLLRWHFDYVGNLPKYGQWSRAASRQEDMAYCQNKEGLVRASVEGKNVVTREVVTLAECDGHDFVNFQWMAEFRAKSDGSGTYHHVGLKLVTRENWVEVYTRGQVKIVPRTEEDKKFHYATFGR